MRPDVVAKNFAHVRATCQKNNIRDEPFVFKLDESGLSFRGMKLGGREKCIITNNAHDNTKYLIFRGSIDHISLMPIASGTGQAYTHLVVLPGKETRYRQRNGVGETPQDFYRVLVTLSCTGSLVWPVQYFVTGRRCSSRKHKFYEKTA